jgi:hypothetical protein
LNESIKQDAKLHLARKRRRQLAPAATKSVSSRGNAHEDCGRDGNADSWWQLRELGRASNAMRKARGTQGALFESP